LWRRANRHCDTDGNEYTDAHGLTTAISYGDTNTNADIPAKNHTDQNGHCDRDHDGRWISDPNRHCDRVLDGRGKEHSNRHGGSDHDARGIADYNADPLTNSHRAPEKYRDADHAGITRCHISEYW
jgi:hypothetical protein